MKLKIFLMGIISMLGSLTGCKATEQSGEFRSVPVDEFEKVISDPAVVRLDVRTAGEYAEGHLAEAPCIDVLNNDFEVRAREVLPQGKTIALYCRSGNRSKKAAQILAAAGYDVVELESGYNGWTAAGKPVTREETDVFLSPSGTMVKMCCIKHGSLRIQFGDKWVYVDPVGKAIPPVTDYSLLPKADVILVTHEHHDHLDKDAIAAISKQGTILITNPRSSELLGGVDQVLKNADETEVLGLSVKAVPAYNSSVDKQQFHPKGRDNGYVLDFDGFRVYIAGDTEDIDEMNSIKDVDVAFLPCNLPFTMTVNQLDHAARMVNPKVLFPYHYGTTDIIQAVELLKNTDIDVRIRQYQ